MYQHQTSRKKQRNTRRIVLILIIVLIGIIGVASLFWPSPSKAPEPRKHTVTTTKSEPKKDTPPKIDLQPTVDTWVAGQSGNYGVVVYDLANKAVIASHQPNTQYFTASIYKLYVAYLALIDFQSGAQDPNQVILAGQTRKECIYKMIHSSDSPCGEKILNDMGQAKVTQRLKSTFNLTNTSFPAFTTSAQDAATILQRLQAKQDLNTENTDFILEAMKTQIYRKGLPAGMPDAVVADKIGFNSPENWHDTAIVTLPNGREYVVSILGGNGVSSADIASFGRTIYAKLQAE